MATAPATNISITEILKDFAVWPAKWNKVKDPESKGAYVIGIAGCTNSGKTTLSRTLSEMLSKEDMRTAFIGQDTFYYRKEDVDRIASSADPNILYYNYDTTKALNVEGFLSSIRKAIGENDFVIVEGNMILEIEPIRQLLQRAVFVTLNRDLCEQRRAKRSYNPPDLPGYLEEVVWPAYERHFANAYRLAHAPTFITFVDGSVRNFSNDFDVKMLFLKLTRNLLLIHTETLQLSQAVAFVSSPKNGGISIFLGTTRDNFADKQVVRLEFEAYDGMIYKELDRLCDEVRQTYPNIDRIALFHKVGSVPVGEASVIIAISAPHRRDAIQATEKAIDYLKSRIPIWKKEIYSDGTSSWKANLE